MKWYTGEFCALAEYLFRLSIRDTNISLQKRGSLDGGFYFIKDQGLKQNKKRTLSQIFLNKSGPRVGFQKLEGFFCKTS